LLYPFYVYLAYELAFDFRTSHFTTRLGFDIWNKFCSNSICFTHSEVSSKFFFRSLFSNSIYNFKFTF